MSVRILIVDDHGVLRAGLRALLSGEPDFEVAGEAANTDEAEQLTLSQQPDVALMDISMPGRGGLEATGRLLDLRPELRVLILTVHEDRALLQEAIRLGAAGYILKRAVGSELVDAIRAVARGELYIHSTMTRALLPEQSSRPAAGPTPPEHLTPREIEILRLIARGHTNRQMADMLVLSVRTVESHRANLTDKLGLRSRAELVRYAADHNLL